ncbi:hypothetical protein Htur_4572 (plasmid) [Haloterrigena turkmenica DSM 5511]|uniref:DUF7344 domain-containing protein n=1 Tax=Haloterrigena turkmenica (strain ATCC 51198 / DSM 5511 / JCM 9101 / NCIMB 13204 / VKM B-1734 / 4k) TaxID=543526 RepID=D2S1W9_HALTV|nr:hypothetical protein Htur_4572 [Haloterrigena turkmenica DSM 5511]
MSVKERTIEDVCDTLQLLGHERRFYAVLCLREAQTALTLHELANNVSIRENSSRLREIPDDVITTTQQSLYHVHIPQLRDAGVVAYDSHRDAIRFSNDNVLVESIIDSQFLE